MKYLSFAKKTLTQDYCFDSEVRTQYLSQISESISQFHRKTPTLAHFHHPFIMVSQRSYTASPRNWPNLVKDQWKMRTRRGFITPIPGRTKVHNLRMKKISMLFLIRLRSIGAGWAGLASPRNCKVHIFWEGHKVLISGSCHFNRASNDKLCVEFWIFLFFLT